MNVHCHLEKAGLRRKIAEYGVSSHVLPLGETIGGTQGRWRKARSAIIITPVVGLRSLPQRSFVRTWEVPTEN